MKIKKTDLLKLNESLKRWIRLTEGTEKNKFKIEVGGFLTHYYGNDREVVIPEGVSFISYYAFAGNEKITSVIIPEGVKIIQDCAFFNCKNLSKITLPKSLMKISKSAFEGCDKLNQDGVESPYFPWYIENYKHREEPNKEDEFDGDDEEDEEL